jgi:lipid-A-disaccharide synthase
VGGAHLAAEGVEILVRNETLAVMGFVEVLSHVPRHWALLRTFRERLRSKRIALVVLLDYPGFNMKVAAAARAAGVPVLYYITPQVWAWGEGRLAGLAKTITRAACILPFEEALLREHGVNATFVGHPLLERTTDLPDRHTARARLGVAHTARVLALFPGSRAQEVRRHLVPAMDAARILQAGIPGLEVVISVAPTVDLRAADIPFRLIHGDSLTVLRAADAALCKSGTTTLEAAVTGCPLVVVYRTSPVTYQIARRLVRIENIGLVNVVAGHTVATELVQAEFTAERAAVALAPLLDHASLERARMIEELGRVRDMLGTPGASDRVARMAAEMIG